MWSSLPNPGSQGNPPNTPKDPRWTHANWLKSTFHFTYGGEWRNGPTNFGAVRFINDSLLQPERGVAVKTESDLDIVWYVVSGKLNVEVSPVPPAPSAFSGGFSSFAAAAATKKNVSDASAAPEKSVYVVEAGSFGHLPCGSGGVQVRFWNASTDEPVRFLHIGLMSKKSANSGRFQLEKGQSFGVGDDGHIALYRDGDEIEVDAEKRAYAVAVEGMCRVSCSADTLEQHDGARIVGPMKFSLQPSSDPTRRALLMVITVR